MKRVLRWLMMACAAVAIGLALLLHPSTTFSRLAVGHAHANPARPTHAPRQTPAHADTHHSHTDEYPHANQHAHAN